MKKLVKKLKIGVIFGGSSSERDISLISGKAVVDNLDKNKYQVFSYDPAIDLEKLIRDKNKINVAFPVLHGKGGEDGTIQGFLELLNIPYVGSGVLASSLAIDKIMTKLIYQSAKLEVAKDMVIEKRLWQIEKNGITKSIVKKIKFPCVIKPNTQGSSVGVTIVNTEKELASALDLAFQLDSLVLIEKFIKGVEVTASVLGNEKPQALPLIEIVPPPGRFFDREVKYNGQTQEIIPARISTQLANKIKEQAIAAHQALGCRGFSRTDFIIKGQKIYTLETNTIPGLTSESLFPKAAKAARITFPKLLERLISLARE